MIGDCGFFFFQAEDGIRDLVRSRGLGDVYKRQSRCVPKVAVRSFRLSLLTPNWRLLFAVISCTIQTLSLLNILTLPTSDLVLISVGAVSFKKKKKTLVERCGVNVKYERKLHHRTKAARVIQKKTV